MITAPPIKIWPSRISNAVYHDRGEKHKKESESIKQNAFGEIEVVKTELGAA